MALLENHLEQISACAKNIAELPFPPPKIFTNAILNNRDITTLIRDTEPHERALFSVDPNTVSQASRRKTRRGTTFLGVDDSKPSMTQNIYAATDPRKSSLVSRVLGQDTIKELERARSRNVNRNQGASLPKGGFADVEVLLQGAEKLCAAYPLPGVPEKITALRNQYEQALRGVEHYAERVAQQVAQLDKLNNERASGIAQEDENEEDQEAEAATEEIEVTDEMLLAEQEEIREIEQKKRTLEERVHGDKESQPAPSHSAAHLYGTELHYKGPQYRTKSSSTFRTHINLHLLSLLASGLDPDKLQNPILAIAKSQRAPKRPTPTSKKLLLQRPSISKARQADSLNNEKDTEFLALKLPNLLPTLPFEPR
ncbi:MAG: hypothetical protein Q9227_005669 [Pyrenula ochraceoflavens]